MDKINYLKIARFFKPLVIQGFSNFFRVVSSDYGKPRFNDFNATFTPKKYGLIKGLLTTIVP